MAQKVQFLVVDSSIYIGDINPSLVSGVIENDNRILVYVILPFISVSVGDGKMLHI